MKREYKIMLTGFCLGMLVAIGCMLLSIKSNDIQQHKVTQSYPRTLELNGKVDLMPNTPRGISEGELPTLEMLEDVKVKSDFSSMREITN